MEWLIESPFILGFIIGAIVSGLVAVNNKGKK